MHTIVFRGLQSCNEPKMVETRTLKLKLPSPNPESGGWSFIQSLTNTPQTSKQIEPAYVHPMTKNPYSKLSIKSLELCTENLGCETGSDMMGNTFTSLPSNESNAGNNNRREQYRERRCLETKKKNTKKFPPPLTTISGSNSLQVKKIREGGRLVIEAVEVPLSQGCFQAERSNGRLRLSLFRENDENLCENETCENETGELENDLDFQREEESLEELEKDCEEVSEAFVDADMKENSKEVEVKMGIRKFQRLTRCKESGLCNWEPFWVATS